MNRLKRFALTGLATLTLGLSASKGLEAATLRVPSQYPTIQQAVDAADIHNDEILVSSGVYNENIRIVNKLVYLRSESGSNNTEIRPRDLSLPIIYSRNDTNLDGGAFWNVEIDGFTINGNNNPFIRGIVSDSTKYSTNIFNSTIENCDVGIDFGQFPPISPFPFVSVNVIRNNNIGIRGSNFASIRNLIIDNNQYGILQLNSMNNWEHYIDVRRNTLVRNNVGIKGMHFLLKNNIFAYGNTGLESESGVINSTFENNDFYNINFGIRCDECYTSIPNINADPLFCNIEANDFTLHSNSPCACDDPYSNVCTIGAFEVGCESTPTVRTSWGKLKSIYR